MLHSETPLYLGVSLTSVMDLLFTSFILIIYYLAPLQSKMTSKKNAFNVVLVGEAGTGKSCLTIRFIADRWVQGTMTTQT